MVDKQIRSRKEKLNALLELTNKIIPNDLLLFLPKRWWFIGDVLITTIPIELQEYKKQLGEAFLTLEKHKTRVVLGKIGPTINYIRTPEFELLAGDANTETIHKELGTKFKIDAANLTFSPGNHGERKRLLQLVAPNEFIIDMFSCVGNLSLPIAVHKSPKRIIAAEINPKAFRYLEENIRLNHVEDRMTALLGDNRVILEDYFGFADRVLSGYLNSDEKQLITAIQLCKKGGIIHFHQAIPTSQVTFVEERIHSVVKNEKRSLGKIYYKRVKKYAPSVDHIVFDFVVE